MVPPAHCENALKQHNGLLPATETCICSTLVKTRFQSPWLKRYWLILQTAFSAASLWSVFWLLGGHTLNSYLAQRGINNFLCPEFREDNVVAVTLTHGWHTAATLRGRLGHLVHCFNMQNCCDVHIRPLLRINRSSWDWIKSVAITHDVFCTFQGCV